MVCRGEDSEPSRTGARPPRPTRLFAFLAADATGLPGEQPYEIFADCNVDVGAKIELIECRGTAYEMGRQYGEARPETLRSACQLHSYLSATIGSTFAARLAGMRQAASATATSSSETHANVTGSVGVTP